MWRLKALKGSPCCRGISARKIAHVSSAACQLARGLLPAACSHSTVDLGVQMKSEGPAWSLKCKPQHSKLVPVAMHQSLCMRGHQREEDCAGKQCGLPAI